MMMTSSPEARIRAALDSVINPRTGKGLAASEMIADFALDAASGEASFTFLLRRDDPATLVRQARQAITAIGLPQPKIKVVDPAGPPGNTHPAPQSAQAGVPAAPTPIMLPEL